MMFQYRAQLPVAYERMNMMSFREFQIIWQNDFISEVYKLVITLRTKGSMAKISIRHIGLY